jgi:Putative zinc-finger
MKTIEHISETMMRAFCFRNLPAMETIVCAEHIEVCTECSELFNHVSKSNRYSRPIHFDFSANASRINDHLDYEQLSDYLDAKLDEDEGEVVNAHLKLCSNCYTDCMVLREFRETIEPELKVRYAPRSILKKILELLKHFRPPKLVLAYGVIMTLIFMTSLVAIIQLRRTSNFPESQGKSVASPTDPPLSIQTHLIDQKVVSTKVPKRSRAGKGNGNADKRNVLKIVNAIYDNGKHYGLDNDGNPVGLMHLPPDIRDDIAKVLRRQNIDRLHSIDELTSVSINERGGVDDKIHLELLSPVGTLIKEERPVLKWKPLKDGAEYIVEIVDSDFNPVERSPKLTATEWLAPNPLRRDQIYIWQVTAFKGNEIIENQLRQIGKFKIISLDKLSEIEKDSKKYDSHLVLGIRYFKEGLLEEAKIEFKHLLDSNPDSNVIMDMYQKCHQVIPVRLKHSN